MAVAVVPAPSARRRLLDAALERFQGEGALNATLDEVRRDAGVSVGALYHHFSDKRALATALYLQALESYAPGVVALLRSGPEARRGVEGVVRYHLRWSSQHQSLARFLLGERATVDGEAVAEASRPFLREAMAWYRQHAHYGAVRRLSFDVAYALWLGPSQEYLRHWLPGRARTVSPAVVGELASAAWNTLKESA